jgi:hypothetical protein
MANEIVGFDLQFGGGKQAEETVISIKKQLRDATAQVALLAEKYGVTSKEATEAAKRAGQLRDQIDLSNQLINGFNPDTKFKAATSALSGLASAFGGLQGAIGLFGVESEDVAKTLLKVQSALALSQGLEALGELKDSFAVLKSVVLDAFKAIRAAIGSTGIGLLVIALGAIYTYWDDIKEVLGGVSSEQKKVLNDAQKTADAQKKNLDAITESENVLKLQGKTEKEILAIKIKQTEEALKSQVTLLETQQSVARSQEEIAERNKQILQSVIRVISAPLYVLLKSVDEVGAAFGKTFGLEEKLSGGLASLVFDPKQVKEEGDKVAKETNKQITKLKNDLAGYKLDVGKINQAASDKELKKREEEADKEIALNESRIKRLFELQKIGGTEYENKLADLNAQYKIDKELFAGHQEALLQIEKKYDLQKFELAKERRKLFEKEADEYAEKQLKKLIKQADKEAKERLKLEEILHGGITRITKAADDAQVKNKEITEDKKNEIISNGLRTAAQLAGENTVLGKALAIADATFNTYVGASRALKDYPAPFSFIAAATTIAQGLMTVNAILSTPVPGGISDTSGGMQPRLMSAPVTPSFTPNAPTSLDQTSINAIGNVNARAYVVESDITGSQKRIRRIENSARI